MAQQDAGAGDERGNVGVETSHRTARRRFRPSLWIINSGLVVLFLAYSLPRYLTGDSETSLIPIDAAFPGHYGLLLLHIGTGSIAMVTMCLQIIPWLRRRYPIVHRLSGRLYVFAGILPSAVISVAIIPFGLLGAIGAVGSVVWAVLTCAVTLAGWWMARQGRYAEHRRFMIYSFGLTAGVIAGRILFNGAWYGSQLMPGINLNVPLVAQVAGFWLNWMVTFGIAHLWLVRTAPRAMAELTPTARAS